jgi:hypothetical protein
MHRIFCTQIAELAGHTLDWSGLPGPTNNEASRDAMKRRDFIKLLAMLSAVVQPSPP